MAIFLDLSVSGERLGSELANDPEELAYALQALASDAGDHLYREVSDHLFEDPGGVVLFLRCLADQIAEDH